MNMIEKMILILCLKAFNGKEQRIECVEAMVNCVYKVQTPDKSTVNACWAQKDYLIDRIRKLQEED